MPVIEKYTTITDAIREMRVDSSETSAWPYTLPHVEASASGGVPEAIGGKGYALRHGAFDGVTPGGDQEVGDES
jgi:hypothetical protein